MSLIEEALRRIKEPLPGQPRPPLPRAAQASQQDEGTSVHSWPVAQSQSMSSQPHAVRTTQNSLAIVAMTVLGLAAILLIGGMVWMLGRNTANLPPVTQASSAPTVTLPTPPHTPLAKEESPEVSSTVRAADQPAFAAHKPSTVPERAQGELVVSGVIEGLGEPYAVINGMIVGVGDPIAGTLVLAIGNGEVTVRRNDGSDVTLRVVR